MRKSLIALLLFTLGSTFAVQAADEAKPFITAQELDLAQYLPAPPADVSVVVSRRGIVVWDWVRNPRRSRQSTMVTPR